MFRTGFTVDQKFLSEEIGCEKNRREISDLLPERRRVKKVCFFSFLTEIVNRIQSKLNASYNCIDRHLETKRDQTAFIWEGDDQDDVQKITYGQGL